MFNLKRIVLSLIAVMLLSTVVSACSEESKDGKPPTKCPKGSYCTID
jgi:hypothetical protein